MKDYDILVTNIEVCDKHAERMNAAILCSKQLFPITTEILEKLSDANLFALDTLITRFAKLQDTIGHKIFPLIIKLFMDEDPEKKTFIDIMNSMEKIEALESKELWENFRKIRNSITHDYPDYPNTCKQLNLCANTSHDLISYWQFLKKFIDDKVLVHYKTEAL